MQDEILKIYENATNDVLFRISDKVFDLAHILNHYTIDPFDKQGESLISIMINEGSTEIYPHGKMEKWQDYIGAPVESFLITQNLLTSKHAILKCFTFFNVLQQDGEMLNY